MTTEESPTTDQPSAPAGAMKDGPRGRAGIIRRAAVVGVIVALVAGVLAALAQAGAFSGLLGFRAATSPKVAATPTEVATPAGPPATIYDADWTHGPDDYWTLPAGWSTANGQLVASEDADGEAQLSFPIIAPYYTVSFDVEGLQGSYGRGAGTLTLIGRDPSGKRLFDLIIECLPGGCEGNTNLLLDYPATSRDDIVSSDSYYQLGTPHNFQIHVAGTTIVRCLVDCDWTGRSAVALSPVYLTLGAHHIQATVTRFVITLP